MGSWWDVFWNDGDLNLDMILVPTGVLFLLVYHVFLVVKIRTNPNSTVIGFENGNKRVWVRKMMQDMQNNVGTALSVLSSNTSAALSMITLSVTLSSLIGTVVGGNGKGSSSSSEAAQRLLKRILYGSSSQLAYSIKYASLMICFLVAFGAHVQSLRYLVHATFLISTPDTSAPVDYVADTVVKGSNCWNVGLRALYVSFPLLLWIFGPVPMFVCCLGLISVMCFMDTIPNPVPPFDTVIQKKQQQQQQQPKIGWVSPPPGPSNVFDDDSKPTYPLQQGQLGAILFAPQVFS